VSIGGVLIVVVVCGYLGYVASRVLKYGGFRAAAFGAAVTGKIGEVRCSRRFLSKREVFVYRLDGVPTTAVGIEFAGGMSGRMQIAISIDETTKLISLMEASLLS
jgi:ABC-type phosphonate transport system ATPase subunit